MRAVVTLALLLIPAALSAQETRFRFAPGDVFATTVEQTTTVTETRPADGKKPAETLTSTAKLALTRRWAVRAIDPAGIATLDMTLSAMKQEIIPAAPKGERVETITIDSSNPEGQAALKAVLNQPLLAVKLDPSGKLIGVEAKGNAPTGRVDVELPFRLVWPPTPVVANSPWSRTATLTLDPPHGTGERLELVQTFTLKSAPPGGGWVIGMTTRPKVEPTDPAVRLAVAPVLWEGEIDFDPTAGRTTGCRLKVTREVEAFAGPGSKFRYESTLVETLLK